ncbi:MAG: ATP-binding protein [Planctomycetota bacterium]
MPHYIPRLSETALKKALKSFPVVVLTGARQAGKTTMLLERFARGRNFASLDAPDVRALAREDPRGFLERHSPPAIIDEIQNEPGLLPYIKERVDRERGKGRYILTGSRHFPLMEGVSESLAGRAGVLSLFPLGERELRRSPLPGPRNADAWLDRASRAKSPLSSKDLGERLLHGGYPALHAQKGIDLPLFFSSYIQTYLDRDVRGNIRNENLGDFESFLRLAAARTGQLLNLSTLAGEVGVTVPTIKSWMSILEAASIVFFLRPYHKNFGKRLIRSPKFYFLDTGLAAHLTGLQTADHLESGPMAGALFETHVVSEVFKRFRTLAWAGNLYFWRSTDGHEVDLLVEAGGKLTALEIKRTATVKPGHTKGLDKWREISGAPASQKTYLVTSSDIGPTLWRGIGNIHWAAL